MNKKIMYISFLCCFLFLFKMNVNALTCSYNISGYMNEDPIWTVDSSASKPAKMVKNIGPGAGKEKVQNWSTAQNGYKAKDDIDNGTCPEYLIQTYFESFFQGYEVFLSDSAHKDQMINSNDIQKYWYMSRSVIVFKLMDREAPGDVAVKCSYVDSTTDSYYFTLNYDSSGNLVGADNVSDKGVFLLSYSAYETQLESNTCNVTAYRCIDTELMDYGYGRIYLNAEGLLSEDETFENGAYCTKYEFSQETSESESGITPTVTSACKTGQDYMDALEVYASEYKACSSTNTCTNGGSLNEFNQVEKKLSAFCDSVYQVANYEDSCVQYCISVDSAIANIKDTYNIDTYDESATCFSARLANWIIKIINWVRYLIPVVLIILSILDFIKAIAADSEDEIKKVAGRFSKRLIASVIIFLLPLLIEFLLGIFGFDTNNFCL